MGFDPVTNSDLFFVTLEVGQKQPGGHLVEHVDAAVLTHSVFTGVSGSGKSSLVFGTIAAESQRLAGCKAFLTNDRRLPAVPGLRVMQLSSYVSTTAD